MTGDFRDTIVGCGAANCRFNVNAGETTCTLKLIYIDETGRCKMAEGRPPKPPQQSEKKPGRFENGVWIS